MALIAADKKLALDVAAEIDQINGGHEYSAYCYAKIIRNGDGEMVGFAESLHIRENRELFREVAGKLITEMPEEAVKMVEKLGNRAEDLRVAIVALKRIASLDSGKAFELLDSSDSAVVIAAFQDKGMVSELSQLGTKRVSELLSRVPFLETRSGVFETAAIALARQEPREVAEWVSGFPEGDARDRIMRATLNVFALDDPQKAKDYVSSLGSDNEREVATEGLVQGWSLKSPEAPAEILKWLENEPIRNDKKLQIGLDSLGMAATKFPGSVASIVESQISAEPSELEKNGVKEVFRNIGQSFSRIDAEEGIEWVESFPDTPSEYQNEGFRAFFSEWIANNPEKAVSWADSLQGQRFRELSQEILSEEAGGG